MQSQCAMSWNIAIEFFIHWKRYQTDTSILQGTGEELYITFSIFLFVGNSRHFFFLQHRENLVFFMIVMYDMCQLKIYKEAAYQAGTRLSYWGKCLILLRRFLSMYRYTCTASFNYDF